MATIVTRAGKGSALTHAEVDANFNNLNNDKVEKSGTDPVVISVNSSSNALRITQTGAGNALVVEDSANPDSTPVVVTSTGELLVGTTDNTTNGVAGGLIVLATNRPIIGATSASGTPTTLVALNGGNQAADRGVAIDMYSPGTGLGVSGAHATARLISASSNAGTQGGYLRFDTENTSGALAERMRIDSSGNVGIGTTSPAQRLDVRDVNRTGNASNQVIYTTTAQAADIGGTLGLGGLWNATDSTMFGVVRGGKENSTSGNYAGYLSFGTVANGSSINERMRIDSSGFTQFSSNLVMPYQGAPTSKSTTATLTGAELITGILNTTGTTYTVTLPTGTNIEGALTWSANNVALDWWVINTASGTITIGANGNTTLGSLTIATGTSAHFRIRRTAANTFTVYRLG